MLSPDAAVGRAGLEALRGGADGLAVRLFGPVELSRGDQVADLGPPQRRCVLAALAVDAGRPVTIEVLVRRVWGEEPPPGANRAVYAHIARLRQALRQPDAETDTGGHPATVLRRSGGYLFQLDLDRVDLHRFTALVAQARDGGQTERVRLSAARQAVGIWREPPLAGITGEWAARCRSTWTQRYLQAVETWADAELAGGDPAAVIARVSDLVAEHPLVEPLVRVLMLALHRTGRTERALACYTAARRRLVDELGAEPGERLRQVHQAILRDDTGAPDGGPGPGPAIRGPAESGPVPAQLPPDVRGFTGRTGELERLDAVLATAGQQPTAAVVLVLSGPAGVGKTALAVHWTHRVRVEFPDGQLYLNLRGFDPTRAVLDPAAAVRIVLAALGVSPERIPAEPDAQVGLYRSLLSDRRMLVVLDNARDIDQVRPLLPGSPSCLTVITSRNRLAGLVAAEGAHPLPVDLLATAQAEDLLIARLGPGRLSEAPTAVDEIIARCGRLPLALAIVAARAATDPGLSLAALADELRRSRGNLDGFDLGEASGDVRSVFSWSYQALEPAAADLFRRLGRCPGPDVGIDAIAALVGADRAGATRVVASLLRLNLIDQTRPDRFTLHELLSAYAAECAGEPDQLQPADRAALTRLIDHYLVRAATAARLLFPGSQGQQVPEPDRAGLRTAAQARSWLEIEHANLAAVVGHAARYGWSAQASQLGVVLAPHLDTAAHYADALPIYQHARLGSQAVGDQAAEGILVRHVGRVHWRLARYGPAHDCYLEALAILQAAGDLAGQAETLGALGAVYWRWGRYPEALDHTQQARDLYQLLGDQLGVARAAVQVGTIQSMTGRHREALAAFQASVESFRAAGDRLLEGRGVGNIAYVHLALGELATAFEHYQRALEIHREVGDRVGEANALDEIGNLCGRLDRRDEAVRHHLAALEIYREIGDRAGEGDALTNLGVTLHGLGRPDEAIEHHQQAVTIAVDTSDRRLEAKALNGLGEALRAAGRVDEALSRHRAALAVAGQIGNADEQVRARSALAGC